MMKNICFICAVIKSGKKTLPEKLRDNARKMNYFNSLERTKPTWPPQIDTEAWGKKKNDKLQSRPPEKLTNK